MAVIDRIGRRVLRVWTVGGTVRRIGFHTPSGAAIVANEFGWVDVLP
jgi:hypothetical protein